MLPLFCFGHFYFKSIMALVSLYPHCRTTSSTEKRELEDVFSMMRAGYWQDQYFEYKNGTRRKEDMPCFSPSALFGDARKREQAISVTGIVNIDIDAKDNSEIDLPSFKDTLYGDEYTYAGHLSLSGKGLSLYIKINPEKHLQSFLALEKYYAEKYRIIIDPATKDITRLRFVVYDPELYINLKASKFTKSVKKEEAEYILKNYAFSGETDIEHIISQIERDRVDLTVGYSDWVKIAMALNKEFGSAGEDFFHRISQFNAGYDAKKCSDKYKQCKGGSVTISSLFWLAKQAGFSVQSPKTRELLRASDHAKKYLKDGTYTKETAESVVMQTATDIIGIPEADAKKAVHSAFSGGSAAEQESADEVYEWITKDIESKKFKRNLITDSIECDGTKFSERALSAVMVELRTRYGSNKVKKDIVLELIDTKAQDYHPIYDFIQKNKKRKPRGCIDSIINAISGRVEFLSKEEGEDFRRYYITKWLLGMMSGWHGTYSLLTLVFVGDQYAGKTKWFRNLFPEEFQPYYAEAKMDGDKDHLTLMSTKILILDDEFSGKSRKEEALFKELSSKQEITIRKPYARMAETFTRIAALAGTTNDESIKNDQTGNRRLIPIHIGNIDWELYDSVDKTDLIMEVYHLWKEVGDKWMLSRKDISRLNFATDRYKEVCPEDELLQKYFDPADKSLPDSWMTNTEVLQIMTAKLSGGHIKVYQKKLGQVLKSKKYTFKAVKRNGSTSWCYNIQERISVTESRISTEPTPF